MRTLIVEDDPTSRILMQTLLSPYGGCHVAVNGLEAIQAYGMAKKSGNPYDLICMDIVMPDMDGQTALTQIRDLEEKSGTLWKDRVRIVMTTGLNDLKRVAGAFRGLCDAYVTKPIDPYVLREHLRTLDLVQ